MRFLLAAAVAVALGGNAMADAWTGDGATDKWEDADNWLLDAVPTNNGSGNTFINGGHNVLFDADTWAALDTAGNLQSATQYRVVRFLINESTAATSGPIGTNSLTFDFGDGLEILQTNGTSAVFGGRNGSDTTLNIVSGLLNTGSRTSFGARVGASGTVNVMGGDFIIGRVNLQLGINNAFDTTTGTGVANISGGTFRTRRGVAIGGTSTFHVAGSGVTEIGVGSQGSEDGVWTQVAGGTLRTGIDAGGITAILVDDVDDDGGGTQGNVTFAAGSILDPYDLGGAPTNVWTTIMNWEGTLDDNGLVLSSDALNAGWEKRVDGNSLQVRLVATAVPEPSSLALLGLGSVAFVARRRRS
tara:strand:+ start:145644 stop:146717 length:1074 start_codon:yes stop_codon:yes gene_type:complete